jgi:hypothetical protein
METGRGEKVLLSAAREAVNMRIAYLRVVKSYDKPQSGPVQILGFGAPFPDRYLLPEGSAG